MWQRSIWAWRLIRALIIGVIIVCGLLLRRFGYDLDLSFFTVKYGGSVLWGGMVFFIVVFAAGPRRILLSALIALVIAVCVEFSRLYHTPHLDAFRLTLAGKLLLGRVFSLWNIFAYAMGIGLAVVVEICVSRLTTIKVEAVGRK